MAPVTFTDLHSPPASFTPCKRSGMYLPLTQSYLPLMLGFLLCRVCYSESKQAGVAGTINTFLRHVGHVSFNPDIVSQTEFSERCRCVSWWLAHQLKDLRTSA